MTSQQWPQLSPLIELRSEGDVASTAFCEGRRRLFGHPSTKPVCLTDVARHGPSDPLFLRAQRRVSWANQLNCLQVVTQAATQKLKKDVTRQVNVVSCWILSVWSLGHSWKFEVSELSQLSIHAGSKKTAIHGHKLPAKDPWALPLNSDKHSSMHCFCTAKLLAVSSCGPVEWNISVECCEVSSATWCQLQRFGAPLV